MISVVVFLSIKENGQKSMDNVEKVHSNNGQEASIELLMLL